MADGLPLISLQLDYSGTPVVDVAETPAPDYQTLVELAPGVLDPQWVRLLAQAVNHLAHGYQYEVILEPGDFEAQYREAYAAEDPDEDVAPGMARLHNYGMPDFSEIRSPAMQGKTLVFFARHTRLGVPYRVEAEGGNSPSYAPLDMAPED